MRGRAHRHRPRGLTRWTAGVLLLLALGKVLWDWTLRRGDDSFYERFKQ